ncbi:uncharacterized protein [Diadema antillarum]|uniref:uncharacterized protein n=1 Tax=Diadema antillarum TaxID=105358 RepID=UPI003A870647
MNSNLINRGVAKIHKLRQVEEEVNQSAAKIHTHLTEITGRIAAAEGEERKQVADKHRELVGRINLEADKEIMKINLMRRSKLEQAFKDANDSCKIIHDNTQILACEIAGAQRRIDECVNRLKSRLGKESSAINDAHVRVQHHVTVGGKRLPNDFQEAVRSLTENLDEELVNSGNITEIAREVEKLQFKRGQGCDIGKLEGVEDRWMLKNRDLYQPVTLLGCTGPDEIVFEHDGSSVYTSNIKDKKMQKVTKISGTSVLTTTTHLSGGKFVAGTTNDTLELFHQTVPGEWRYLRALGDQAKKFHYVAVDRGGLILAAQSNGSTVHVFDPNEGRPIGVVTLENELKIRGLAAMPSGPIAVLTNDGGKRVRFVDGSGRILFSTNFGSKNVTCIAADRVKDSLYCLHHDSRCGMVGVHEISIGREATPEEIIKLDFEKPVLTPSLAVPSSGTLVIEANETLYCYKKTPYLHHLMNELNSK